MDARGLEAKEKIPASHKLSEERAREILRDAKKLVVAKGKKLSEFNVTKKVDDEAVQAMLGPTGNLRAPTLVVGKTVFVGFNEEVYADFFD